MSVDRLDICNLDFDQQDKLRIFSKTHSRMAPALRAFALALRASSICPSSPTCPQDDQCSLTSNGATLQVSCATDYYGGDLQLAQVSMTNSAVRCIDLTANLSIDIYVSRLHPSMLHDHGM